MARTRSVAVLPVATTVRLPSGRCVEVQGARVGKGVREPELLCRYLHYRLGYPLACGDKGRNEVWLTQRFVLAHGELTG